MFTQLFRHADPYQDLRQLQRHMDALFGGVGRAPRRTGEYTFDVFDDGEHYRLVADVPGLRAEELEVEVTEDGVTVRGARTVEVPEGYTVHRREREGLQLARSLTLPSKLDPEKVEATLQQGVLTITLTKRADAKPRSVTVRSVAA